MRKIYQFFVLFVLLGGFYELKAQVELWGVTAAGGDGFGTLFSMTTGSTAFSSQRNFAGAAGSSPQLVKLIQASNGKLYGTTLTGGINNLGVILEFDPTTNTYAKKYDFAQTTGSSPRGSLMQASNGKLYGMTSAGGTNSLGVIFEYDITTATYTKKVDLSAANGSQPFSGLTELSPSNGKLYGMTRSGGTNSVGVIFEYDLSSGTYTKKIDLSLTLGQQPSGDFVQSGTMLYGLTATGGTASPSTSGGTILEYDYTNNVCTKKLDLNTTLGCSPSGSLLKASDGNLYGLTTAGGVNSLGVIFQYSVSSATYTKLYDFSTAQGSAPPGSLTQASSGKLYGMTRTGGANLQGAIFEYDYTTLTYTKKFDLQNNTTIGGLPFCSPLIASNGKLYGLTSSGGISGGGVLYDYDISSSTYTKRIDLNVATSGGVPNGGVVYASNGKIYGTTNSGGANNLGVIFEYDRITSTYTKKIDMTSTGGSSPNGALMEASNGKIYGLNNAGGTGGLGSLYEYDYSSNTYTKKVDLTSGNGSGPLGNLIQAANGKLYGMTRAGGSSGLGVIFEYNTSTSTYTKKVDFTGSATGQQPSGSLVEAPNGKLYGMTQLGGANSQGAIFEYDYSASTFTKKIDLSTGNGSQPLGSLVLGGDGMLYGLTKQGGANNLGVLFQYDYVNNVYTKKVDLSATTGSQPQGSLVKAASGKIYGVTTAGGTSGLGTLFEYDVTTSTLTKLIDLTTTTGCSPGYTKLIEVCVKPSTPGAISATTNSICANSITAQNFSVAAVATATSYAWTLPAGASITSGNNTNAITVNLSAVTASVYTYSVGATNQCGTSTSLSTKVLTVTANPTISASGGTICSGSSFTIVPSGAATYSVSGGSTVVAPGSTTSYSVTGTSAEGCSGSNTAIATVNVNSLPPVTANANSVTICSGVAVTLTGSGANSYTWTNGVTDGVAFTPTATNSYTVTGMDANGCKNTASKAVTVNPLPVVTATSSSNAICAGGTVILNGIGATTYVWTNGVTNGIAFSPATTNTYTVTGTDANGCQNTAIRAVTVNPLPAVTATSSSNAICAGGTVALNGIGATTYVWTNGVSDGVTFSPASTNIYTVTGTDANGCQNTATRAVTVNPLPVVTATSSSNAICTGGTLTLNGIGATTYTWTNGVTDGLVFSPVTTNTYTVTGTDANGCQNTATRAVTVNPLPAVTATSSSNAICIGSTVTVNGIGATTYAWSNGVTDGIAFSPTVTVTYTVTGTDVNGCQNTATRSVTVNPLPAVTATSSSNAICAGGTVVLNGNGATSYAWSSGVINGAAFSPTITDTYTVTGADANGCQNTANISVTVNPLPVLSVNSGSMCSGDIFNLVPSGAASYTFSGATSTVSPGTITVSPAGTATYAVMGTNSLGCVSASSATSTVTVYATPVISASNGSICSGDTFIHSPSGATSYSFVPSGPAVSPTLTTTYSITGTSSAGCVSSAAAIVTVTVYQLPNVSISGSSSVCSGSSLTLTASGANTYTWDSSANGSVEVVSPTVTTTYSIIGVDNNNCSSTATISVSLFITPTITVNNGVICPGDSFSIIPSGASSFSYSGGSSIVSPTVTSSYTVTGIGSQGCAAISAVATVSVVNVLTVSISGNTVICAGESVTLTASGANGYIWNSTSTSSLNTIIATPTTNTSYSVIGSSGACWDSTSVMVLVNPMPMITAVTTVTSLCVNENAILSAGGADTYTWLPNNISGQVINVTPTISTTYTVVGTDLNGCIGGTLVSLSVDACVGIKKQTGALAFELYPNPNLGEFIIISPEATSMTVQNALGEVVMQGQLNEGKNAIDLGENAKGIYFVKIRTGNNSHIIKVVKQ